MACYSATLLTYFFDQFIDHRDLHSFPTRRSSDLHRGGVLGGIDHIAHPRGIPVDGRRSEEIRSRGEDRKSTRLNSSHITISYAVFCLKKKNAIQPVLQHHDALLIANHGATADRAT